MVWSKAANEHFAKVRFGPRLLQVVQYRLPYFGQQWEIGCGTSLVVANADDLIAPILVIQTQHRDLPGAHSVCRKQHQDCVIAYPFRRAILLSQGLDFLYIVGSNGRRYTFEGVDRRGDYGRGKIMNGTLRQMQPPQEASYVAGRPS